MPMLERIGSKGSSTATKSHITMPSKRVRRKQESGHFSGDLAWRDAVEHAFRSMLDHWETRKLTPPSFRVIALSKRGNAVEAELRFLRNQKYCCYNAPCAMHVWDSRWWQGLRTALAESTSRQPPPFRLRLFVVVEAGSKLEANPPVGFVTAKQRFTFTERFNEIDSKVL